MRTTVALLTLLLATTLAGCSGDATEKPDADDKAAVAPRPVDIPADADGVVQSVDARAGTALVTDWDGVDHIVPDAGLEDAEFVTYDGHVARPVEMGRGGTSAGKVAPLEGAEVGSSSEQGIVKWFNDAKGYGFIVRERGADVFVHHASIIAEGFRTLAEGDHVQFQVVEGPKGLQAVNVVKVS